MMTNLLLLCLSSLNGYFLYFGTVWFKKKFGTHLTFCGGGKAFFKFIFVVGKKADCTLTMSDQDLLELMTGKLNPQMVCSNKLTTTICARQRLI